MAGKSNASLKSTAQDGADMQASSEDRSIDQVRKLLFGEESAAQSARTAELEESLQNELHEVALASQKRDSSIERRLDSAQATFSKHLSDERDLRVTDVARIEELIRDEIDKLRSEVQANQQSAMRSLEKLGDRLDDQLDSLHGELLGTVQHNTAKLESRISETAAQLGESKAERVELSDMFITFAEQLNPARSSK